MAFTDSQKHEYLKDTDYCPHCRSLDIEGTGSFEMYNNGVSQMVRCNECGCEWWDIYTITDIQKIGQE